MKTDTITKDPPHIQSNGIDIDIQPTMYGTTHPTEVHGMFDDLAVCGYQLGVEGGHRVEEFCEERDL